MNDTPIKSCDYCSAKGKMPTFMNGETVCHECLSKQPSTIPKAYKAILNQQATIEKLCEALDEAAGWCANPVPAARYRKLAQQCRAELKGEG